MNEIKSHLNAVLSVLLAALFLVLGCGNKPKPDTTTPPEFCAIQWKSDDEILTDHFTRDGNTETIRRMKGAIELKKTVQVYEGERVVERSIFVDDKKLAHTRISHTGTTMSIEEIDDSDVQGEPGVDGVIDVVVTVRRDGANELSREIERKGFPKIDVSYEYDSAGNKVVERRKSNDVLLEVQTFTYRDDRKLATAKVDLGADSTINYEYEYVYDSHGRLTEIRRTGEAPATFEYRYQCTD